MNNWGDDFEPAPLKLACASCGSATEHRDRMGLCAACRKEYDEDMAAVQALDRSLDDRDARRRFYGG